jgi:hypothetical protein
LGVQLDQKLTSEFSFTFPISGALHHRIGSLIPPEGVQPNFAQIYFYDGETRLRRRQTIMPDLNTNTLHALQPMIHQVNPFSNIFQAAAADVMSWKVQTLSLNICANELRYDRRYSRPTHADVAALLPGDVLHAGCSRHIILYSHLRLCTDGER